MSKFYLLYENKKILLQDHHPLIIGRDPACDVILGDAHVSRKHASLELRDGKLILIDLESANGTWLEGKPVEKAIVSPGTSFRIADNNLAVRPADAEASGQAAIHDTMVYEGKIASIISMARDPEIKKEVAVLRYLYNQKKEKLTGLAFYDGLMGIYNRRYFELKLAEELSRSIRYHHPLALLMVDIDHFKQVNDRFGHQKGDEILRLVAEVLGKSLRGTDMVFRYGGEEIAIILGETSGGAAVKIAENCRSQVEAQSAGSIPGGVTASIGLACLQGAMKSETLIKQADQALYQAKESGRNRVVLFEA